MIHRALILACLSATAWAQPSFMDHSPTAQVYNQASGITGREPDAPRETETVDLWVKIGPSFSYDRVWIYYTTDGTEPQGANGNQGNASTTTMASFARTSPNRPQEIFFQYNQPSPFGGNDDWWKATLPASTRGYNTFLRYKISAQRTSGNTTEVFANGGLTFSFLNKLAWPGAGAGQPNPQAGYPPVSFWKEEAFIGNTYTAAMLDQNATWWDMYFPTPGGVQGVGSRNEGYSDGPDTFPPLLSAEKRGQMHLNMATVGVRTLADNLTHWLTNPSAVSYSGVQQAYLADTNTVRTTQTLTANGNNISVTQHDFSPAGIDFPDGLAGTGEQRHIVIKRMTLRNNTSSTQDVNVYLYLDPALNGGDTYDQMFWDGGRGCMTAYDKTRRTVTGTGAFISPPEEYNITTFSGYEKNIALYLTSAMFVSPGPGHANGGPATDAWRDTSADQGQGWIGKRLTLPPGVDVTVNFLLAGAHYRPEPISGNIPVNDGVYDNELVPVLDWFTANSMAGVQAVTDAYWANWLASGTTVDTPDDRFDRLMRRSLLATALHQDAVNGAVVAGYHNGAYYFAWPRDAMWAAVTLIRTGHLAEGANALRWMRDITYRDTEPSFGNNPVSGQPYRGFWKQKYTTDGFTVWGAPQIDGTAVYPWAMLWYDRMTADTTLLNSHYPAIVDAVAAMTRDSIDSRLRYEEAFNLVYSNNLWEDQYDTFNFSNANVIRGLRDAAAIATTLGRPADSASFTGLANTIKGGLDARLDWDGENTDASQLGIVYPFEVYTPTEFRATRIVDRINGVRRKFNNAHPNAEPLVRFAGFPNDQYGWTGLIDRYWGDGYWGGGTPWGGGPWFLTTMWYGCYYAMRQDYTAGTTDIDNHRDRLDLLINKLGPAGLGAEQLAPRAVTGDPGRPGSLMYPGQNDFQLQAAWPNAWESMSFFVDSLMMFLDYTPDARSNRMSFRPKLPSAWGTMTFANVRMAGHAVDVTVEPGVHTFTNRTGSVLDVSTVIRVAANASVYSVRRNGLAIPFSHDPAIGAVTVDPVSLATGAGAATEVRVVTECAVDLNGDVIVDFNDYLEFLNLYNSNDPRVDFNGDTLIDFNDYLEFLNLYNAGC